MVLFYAVAGVLALASALLLVRPLLAGRRGDSARADSDAQIYRDQLDEIDRDLGRGTISAEEARAARAEVSRRLLAAADQARTAEPPGPAPRSLSRPIAGLALIGAPALAAAVYLANGAPGLPDLPLAERTAIESSDGRFAPRPSQEQAEADFASAPPEPQTDEQKNYAEMIRRVQEIVAQRPNDEKGLRLLAQGLTRLGRPAESWKVYAKLIALLGDKAESGLYAEQLDAMVSAASGYISPEAETVLNRLLELDPDAPIGRFYQGFLLMQQGRESEAVATWEGLLADSPADAPWRSFVAATLAQVKAASAGPTAEQMQAAGTMSPEDQQAMIEGMVARLEERLTSEGGSAEEWLRLINAYVQLGRREDAARVARLGIAALGANQEAGFLREQALLMGVIEQ